MRDVLIYPKENVEALSKRQKKNFEYPFLPIFNELYKNDFYFQNPPGAFLIGDHVEENFHKLFN